jgi:Bacterial mobilisation protein (MobC)
MRSAEKRCSVARPSKLEKRDRQLNLKLTARELEWVLKRAMASGMRPVDFGRAQLLADRVVRAVRGAAPAHLDPLFLAQLSRIGNNLNQLTRRLNEFHVPAPETLSSVLQEIRDIIRRASADGA